MTPYIFFYKKISVFYVHGLGMRTLGDITVHLCISCPRSLWICYQIVLYRFSSSPAFLTIWWVSTRVTWCIISMLNIWHIIKIISSKYCVLNETWICIVSVHIYLSTGLNPAFTSFLCFALTMSMVSLAGVSLAFLISASVSSFAMANILIALPFVFMMVRFLNKHLHNTYSLVLCHSFLFHLSFSLFVAGIWRVPGKSQLNAQLVVLAQVGQYLQIWTRCKEE